MRLIVLLGLNLLSVAAIAKPCAELFPVEILESMLHVTAEDACLVGQSAYKKAKPLDVEPHVISPELQVVQWEDNTILLFDDEALSLVKAESEMVDFGPAAVMACARVSACREGARRAVIWAYSAYAGSEFHSIIRQYIE